MEAVRVRFAPSPTGFLHIGGVRTALFNWLFAKHHGGKFFLRIEDTDRSRSTPEAIEAITQGLLWLGLNWDPWAEWPSEHVLQTDRLSVYRSKVEELLSKGLAYRCYCLPEELEQRRKEAISKGKPPRYDGRCRNLQSPPSQQTSAIRFKNNPDEQTVIHDLVKGKVIFENSTLDDLILFRSDGTPTYNLSVVVDDGDMKISHVIRGDDHLNNTPKQIQLFRTFGYPVPKFAHLSMILGPDRNRLSKRHGATSVQWYRDQGFLPEALINYLVRLGWSHKDQEIFSIRELIEKFSFEQVGSSAAVFNPEKLIWLNAHYIKTGEPKRLKELFISFLAKEGDISQNEIEQDPRTEQIIKALQERSRTLTEMANSAICFFKKPVMEEKAKGQFLTRENLSLIQALKERFETVTPFSHETLEPVFKEIMAQFGVKMAKLAQPLRVALTGKTVSPGIYDVLCLIGQKETVNRLEMATNIIQQNKAM
ncbi:MAG TPA: glutamate--tRNA ligase [Nitrospiria bacterium]